VTECGVRSLSKLFISPRFDFNETPRFDKGTDWKWGICMGLYTKGNTIMRLL
jgi:hypothetical protein